MRAVSDGLDRVPVSFPVLLDRPVGLRPKDVHLRYYISLSPRIPVEFYSLNVGKTISRGRDQRFYRPTFSFDRGNPVLAIDAGRAPAAH